MENDMPDMKGAKSLIERIEEIKSADLAKDLMDLLEDMLTIEKLKREIKKKEETLYEGRRIVFAGRTLGFGEEQIVLTLEKAHRKYKRLAELEKREENKDKKPTEEGLKKLREMGLIGEKEDTCEDESKDLPDKDKEE